MDVHNGYKIGDKVVLLGYPKIDFTVKNVKIDSTMQITYSLVGIKDNGTRIKFDKDASYILCTVDEYKKAYTKTFS